MSDLRNHHKVAEELADFTDKILDGKIAADGALQEVDRDLAKLQEIVNRMAQSQPAQNPDAAIKNRIRAKFAAEWQAKGPQVRQELGAMRPLWKSPQVFVPISVLVVLLLAYAVVTISGFAPVMQGAVQGGAYAVIVVLVGSGIIALIIWRIRKKP